MNGQINDCSASGIPSKVRMESAWHLCKWGNFKGRDKPCETLRSTSWTMKQTTSMTTSMNSMMKMKRTKRTTTSTSTMTTSTNSRTTNSRTTNSMIPTKTKTTKTTMTTMTTMTTTTKSDC